MLSSVARQKVSFFSFSLRIFILTRIITDGILVDGPITRVGLPKRGQVWLENFFHGHSRTLGQGTLETTATFPNHQISERLPETRRWPRVRIPTANDNDSHAVS